MELLERDGKYFMKLANGELEITRQQAEKMIKERGAVLRNNLSNWMDHFAYKPIPIAAVPATAADFVSADKYYNDIMKELEQIYRANNHDPELARQMVNFCIDNMGKLRSNRSKTRFLAFSDYQVINWLRVQSFLLAMSKSEETVF